ncbi:MAG: bifunctional DNA-formamidopyrimidine glycosylase/DNA-(apurinic or apyrimidinic site) lyase [Dehalococcoidia bacterium]
MPELPEVETIRRDLLPRVVGRTITGVRVVAGAERIVRWASPAEFARALSGQRIEDITRRGKYLLFRLSDGRYLIAHLRMTGAVLHRAESAPEDPYLRICLSLDDGSELRYTDLRTLGSMWLVEEAEAVVGKLGPDALEELTSQAMHLLTERRSASIKAVLMDQRALAGLGNIYSEEALFTAGIHPRRPAKSLGDGEVQRLHTAIGEVLVEAMGHRGSSFRDYVDAEGREGRHQWHVKVYRRTGEPCYNCGTPIERIKLGGRSTHFCPRCQR